MSSLYDDMLESKYAHEKGRKCNDSLCKKCYPREVEREVEQK